MSEYVKRKKLEAFKKAQRDMLFSAIAVPDGDDAKNWTTNPFFNCSEFEIMLNQEEAKKVFKILLTSLKQFTHKNGMMDDISSILNAKEFQELIL